MSGDVPRPDPDQLLRDLQLGQADPKRGRLTLFFGMCPGVGKTFAMLQEAAERQKRDGSAVMAAVVETHGRADTAALLQDMMVLPRKELNYKGAQLQEMDLETVLLMRPDLVLVDELAHSNAPGSRHPKRYQDVLELLDNGIHVYSTLNVQHLESCAQSVKAVTGVEVRETLPDSVLERCSEIRLIDVTPSALRQRLAEGKVYLGERAAAAGDHFFRESNLAALRELALRVMARRVDPDQGGRGAGERLLLALSPDEGAKRSVRRVGSLAYALGAAWAAVYVEGPRPLSREGQRSLEQNLALARELGAEVFQLPHTQLDQALAECARKFRATQLILAEPSAGPLKVLGWRPALLRRLSSLTGLELLVLPAEGGAAPADWLDRSFSVHAPGKDYALAAAFVGVITALGAWLEPVAGYWSVALFYLFGILLLGFSLSRGPAMLAALFSALLWDLLFIPPRFTFQVARVEDQLMLLFYLAIALVTGHMTSRLRQEQILRKGREERAEALFRLLQALHGAPGLDAALRACVAEAGRLLRVDLAFALAASPQSLQAQAHPASAYPLFEHGQGTAIWCHRNLRAAGRYTDTLAGAESLYLCLRTGQSSQGVMGVKPHAGQDLSLEQRDILAAFAEQVGLLLEREGLRRQGEQARLDRLSEQLQKDLLNSLSHELRTPLTVIRGAVEQLERQQGAGSLSGEILQATERLNRLVGNLLSSARLESGQVQPKREWGRAKDLVEGAKALLAEEHRSRELIVSLSDTLPLLHLDFGLAQQALACILDNAFRYSPVKSPVRILASDQGGHLELKVEDFGPGIAPELMPRLFQRFQRAQNAPPGGSGLGLAIAKGFLEAQGAGLTAVNRLEGGCDFIIKIPFPTQTFAVAVP